MKYWIILLVLLVLMIGCAEPLSVDSLIIKDGIFYSSESLEPYSGKAYQLLSTDDVNASIRVEGKYLNGLRHGSWTAYFVSGQLAECTNYRKGILHGKYLQRFSTGSLGTKGIYQNGLMHGVWEYFFETGEKWVEGEFINGDGTDSSAVSGIPRNGRNGSWEVWFKSGRLEQKTSWTSGRLNGVSEIWHENGQLAEQNVYTDGVLGGGDFIRYYDNSQINIQGTLIDTACFKVKEWYPNGQIQSQGTLIDALYQGEWTYWYAGGKTGGNLKSRGSFLNDKQNGAWEYWFPTGQMESQGAWIDGLEHGEWTYWHENGELKSRGNFLYGRQNRAWEYWDLKGHLYMSGNWENGMKCGQWTEWHEGWYVSGKMKSRGNYLNGKQNGIWEYWDSKGRLSKSVNFEAGVENGRHSEWCSSGDVKLQGDMINGNRHGEWVFYDADGLLEGHKYYDNGVQIRLDETEVECTGLAEAKTLKLRQAAAKKERELQARIDPHLDYLLEKLKKCKHWLKSFSPYQSQGANDSGIGILASMHLEDDLDDLYRGLTVGILQGSLSRQQSDRKNRYWNEMVQVASRWKGLTGHVYAQLKEEMWKYEDELYSR